ncbi:MAG: HAMP domain-containing histidine kinase, partial [Planctomycetes bacterium]|nr:HAMP domain-containing histidine kinase [Planctomycetota bacterium]
LDKAVQSRYDLLGLGEGGDKASCRAVLTGANAELGRLNRQLRIRAEKLASRAEAFEHLGRFTSALTGESTTADVLESITAAVAAATSLETAEHAGIVAYSIGADDDMPALAVCASSHRALQWRTFESPRHEREAAPIPASCAEAIDMVAMDSENLTDWIDVGGYEHYPLVCAAEWIGGIFLPVTRSVNDRNCRSVMEALAGAMAPALAIVRQRDRADSVSEQLAGASQVLAATQEALAEAKTLAAMGEMATGAAHELNTPLAVISGRAQLMGEQAETEGEKNIWRTIAEQAQRISDILSELMAFASPPAPTIGQFDAGELLRNVGKTFSQSDHPKASLARVDIQVEEDALLVSADREQIHAAVLELMTNAATAGGSEPHITLAAAFDEADHAVLLTVNDTGEGMDEGIAMRAFTPFFSSQKAGRRRGMGLPMVKRVVENNGGRVWIRSRRDEGTTVYIRLPAVEA